MKIFLISQPTHPLHPLKMNNAGTRGITASAGTTFDSTLPYYSCRHYLCILFFFCRKSFTTYKSSSLFNHFPVRLWPIAEYSPLQPRLPQCAPYLSFAVTVRFLIPVKDYDQSKPLPYFLQDFIKLLIFFLEHLLAIFSFIFI